MLILNGMNYEGCVIVIGKVPVGLLMQATKKADGQSNVARQMGCR